MTTEPTKEETRPAGAEALTLLQAFPNEALEMLLSTFLHPRALAAMYKLNNGFRTVFSSNTIWRDKVKIYFPHIYRRLIRQNQQKVNWHEEFNKAYMTEYKGLSSQQKDIFDLVKRGDLSALQKLGLQPASLLVRDVHHNYPTDWAAKKKHQFILDYFYSIASAAGHHTYENEWTLLHWAIACKQPITTIEALTHPDIPNDIDSRLYFSALMGHTAFVAHLLTKRPNVNHAYPTIEARTLYVAALRGHYDVVTLLLNAGAIVNQARSDDGSTPLFITAQEGHKDVVTQLLAANADVNQPISGGATPLLIAVQKGHIDVVEALLKKNGVEINQATAVGDTPLHIAVKKGHNDIVRLLLDAGANVHQHLPNGSTPLLWLHKKVIKTMSHSYWPQTPM